MSIRNHTAAKLGLAAALLVSTSWLVSAQNAPVPTPGAGATAPLANNLLVPQTDATHLATLTGANGTGTAWFMADEQNNTLRWTIEYEGVNLAGANIACPPAAVAAVPGGAAGGAAPGAGPAGGAVGTPGGPAFQPDPIATAAIPALTGAITLVPTADGGAGGAAGAAAAGAGGAMAAAPGGAPGAVGAGAAGGAAGGAGGAAGGAGGAAGGGLGGAGGEMANAPAPGAAAGAGGVAGGAGGAAGGPGGAAGVGAEGAAGTALAAAAGNEVLDLFANFGAGANLDTPIQGEIANLDAQIFQQINNGACFLVMKTAMAAATP